MIDSLASAVIWMATGIIGWTAFYFIGVPIRNFFNLRAEVIRRRLEYANVRARWRLERDDQGAYSAAIEVDNFTDSDRDRLQTAQSTFRDLAAKFRAFADNEFLASRSLRILGYDLSKASAGLVGLSNTFDTYGESRAFQQRTVDDALKLPKS